MKNLLLLITLYFTASALSAQTKNINAEVSKNEIINYAQLAPLPQPKIDFKEIILKNQARDIDIYEVYAWSKIYENTSDISRDMVNHILKQLSSDELIEANQRLKQLTQDIKDNPKYKPMYPSQLLLFRDSSNMEYEIIPDKTVAPKYPRMAAIAKIQGYVNVNFNVYQDGSARDIYVSSEYPQRIFAKAAMQAISKYRFKIKWKNTGTNSTYKQATTQKIYFKLQGNYPIVPEEKIRYVNKQFELAIKGDIKAQYNFTSAYQTLPIQFNHKVVKLQQINDWLFNSAKEGFKDSQYYLGLTIFNGIGCLAEEQKGFEWMTMAAKKGHLGAQQTLYNWINLNRINNTSGHPASYWLETAANNGALSAKLEFAKTIAFGDGASVEQLKLASSFIEDYAESYGELPQYYQIKALLLSMQGKKSKAKSSIKKAIKLAKKAGWDITELKQQKIMIKKS